MGPGSVLLCRDSETQINTDFLNTIYSAATVWGAADATLVVGMKCRFVIDRDLFARVYVTQGYEEDLIVDDLHERVGRA